MEFVRLTIFLAAVTFIGFNVVYIISFKRGGLYLTEKLFIGYGAGLGLVSLQVVIYYIFKVDSSLINLLLPWLVLVLANCVIYFNNRGRGNIIEPTTNSKHGGLLGSFLAIGIAFEICYSFFRALIKPMESYDAIAIYAIKAKVFFLTKAIPADFFNKAALSLPHPDYPLNIPLSEALGYLSMGSLNDQLVKVIFPLFFTGILAVLYFGVRRFASKTYALLFTFILASIPQFSAYATNGYLDLPLAYYYSASALFLFLWFKDVKKTQFLLISAIMAGLAGWTKNEGLMYCGINIFLLLAFLVFSSNDSVKKKILYMAAFSSVILFISLPWLYIKRSAHLVNEEINLANLTPSFLVSQYKRAWIIIYEFQKQFFGPKKWNIVWIAFISIFILNLRRAFSKDMVFVTVSILLAFMGYVLVYMITSRDVAWHISSTASRFLIHFLPVVVYWLSLMLKEYDRDI